MSERAKKAKLNIVSVLGLEIVTIISGLILPRLILANFGSATNGLVTSVNQFITCVTLLRAGVGGVTRAALYKPLDEGNLAAVSGIVSATTKFMRKLTAQYTVALVIFAAVYPFIVNEEFEWFYAFSMVLILGLSTFFDCCFGISYQFLLQSDQKRYVISVLQILTVIANIIVAVVLIEVGASIHIVKFGSSLVYSVKPLILWCYVHKKYKLNWKAEPDNLAIKQRWDAFAHNTAAFVTNNTTVMVLTLFTDIKLVSVYSVYNMILSPLRTLISSLSSGVEAAFGNMIARGEQDNLKKSFESFATVIFIASAFVFVCVGFLITPFVMVYTEGINDAQYSQPIFGVIMAVAQFLYCIRLPYQILVDTTGHFKQTKNAAIAESVLNLAISVILVNFCGLIGVAIGFLIATLIRTLHFVIYSNKNYLGGSIKYFSKNLVCCAVATVITCLAVSFIPDFQVVNFMSWFIYAVEVGLISLISLVLSYLLFFGKKILGIIKFAKKL